MQISFLNCVILMQEITNQLQLSSIDIIITR